MKKESLSIGMQVFYAYLGAIILSMIFSPITGNLYLSILNLPRGGGLGGYGNNPDLFFIQNIIVALPLFIPLFVLPLVKRGWWLIWFIGVILPLFLLLSGEFKYFLWFIISSIIGAFLGWIIKMIIKKFKK